VLLEPVEAKAVVEAAPAAVETVPAVVKTVEKQPEIKEN